MQFSFPYRKILTVFFEVVVKLFYIMIILILNVIEI